MKFWSQYLQYLQSYLEMFIRHIAAAAPLLKSDNTSQVCQYIFEICPVLWLVTEKFGIGLQRSGTKYRYFIWAKRSTALRAVMVHSVRSITLLLASFDIALPSESEKLTVFKERLAEDWELMPRFFLFL